MKKTACMLLSLLFLFCARAFALHGANYPAWDGASPVQNSICGSFGGDSLKLEFDPSADYSNLKGGMMQACFFAFDAARENYLEMYLQMPEGIAAGDVLIPGKDASLTSVTLYEVAETYEDIYFAGQFMGYGYPEDSLYEIRIEECVRSAESLSVRGSLSGVLGKFDANDRPTGESFRLSDVRFHFELPLSSAAAAPRASEAPSASAPPKASAAPDLPSVPAPSASPAATLPPQLFPFLPTATPRPTMDPHPAFTLPTDYRVI